MSAIAGLMRLDGRPADQRQLERVAGALREYGPDRTDIRMSQTVGFVHALMRITPEDRFDCQPQQGASGALVTADARIDNRDDLLTRIEIARHDAMEWSDSRVILAGWEKLGDHIWPLLRGPFAVAIWDPRSCTLTLARAQLRLYAVMWDRRRRS